MGKDLLFQNFLAKMLKKWYVILFFITFFVLLVFVVQNYLVEREYESKVELLVLPNANSKNDTNDAQIRLNIQLMNTYMNVMKSSNTLLEVKRELHLDKSIDTLRKGLTISSDENSLSLSLKVVSRDSKQAQLIAKGIAEVTQKNMKQFFPDNKIVILNPASTGKLISQNIYYLIAAFAGLWIGIAYIVIETILARTIREEVDISSFDFPILGVIAYSQEERES